MKRKASLNHTFRTVWSDAQQAFVVAAENIKTKGKKSASQQSINLSASVLAALSLTMSGVAFADPSGGNVTSGTATINQASDTTTITQTTQNVNIDWDSFNIDSHETVNFDQPNASALAVNNILDTSASQILGKLNSNGQVWLINPNGIFFGKDAVVNVGSILASTLKPKNGATTDGNQVFNQPGSGAIANQGEITASNGGYVAMISRSVVNDGSITAKNGAVALGAGDKVTVKFANNALVGLNINKNDVLALVDNKDLIKANGGMVLMSAGAKDSMIASVVNNSGKVQARTVQQKDGKIILMGGMKAGTTNVAGTLDVRAPNGGDAGFVETSAAIVNVNVDTKVKLDATSGANGKWQIDPVEFTVGTSPTDHASGHALETALNTGSLEIITSGATGGAGSSGDITVNDSIEWSADSNLTLKAQNDIVVNQQVKASGNAKIKMEAGQAIALNDSIETNASGKAIVLAGQQFTNTAGSGALKANNGRWQVWSNDPSNDTKNGLAYDFKQYNATYKSTPVLGSGNGFLYQVAPKVTVELVGKVNKVYDGNTNATLTSSNYQVTGTIDGDTVTVTNPLTGQYTTNGTSNKVKNVGKNKTVEAYGVSITSASNGGATVYGYELSSSTASGVVGKITKKDITVDAQAQDKVYDGTKAATAVLSSSGVIVGDDVTFSADASFRNKRAKDNKKVDIENITATGSDRRNYTFNTEAEDRANITRKAVDLSINAEDKVYDGTTDAVVNNFQSSGVINGDTVNFSHSSGEFEDKHVGTDKEVSVDITATGKDAGNYAFKSEITAEADITPKTITVSATAEDKVYNGNRKATVSALMGAGIIDNDDVSFSHNKARFDNKNVGTDKTVTVKGISASGADAGNYQFSDQTTTLADITAKAITVDATAYDKIYDGNRKAQADLSSQGVVSGDDISFDGKARFGNKNAGLNKKVTVKNISASGADADNYSFNTQAIDRATISKLAVDLDVVADDKVYDGNKTAVVSTLESAGILSGDDISFSYSNAEFEDKNVGTDKTVEVTGINASGGDANNYAFLSEVETEADITPKALTVTAVAYDKIYDGNRKAQADLSAAGVISGDDISFDGKARFGNKNAKLNKKVTVRDISARGADAGNYSFNDTVQTRATIARLALDLDAVAEDKVYDGNKTAIVQSLTSAGIISGDDIAFSYNSAEFEDKNVGTDKKVEIKGISASGSDANNYAHLSEVDTEADITPKALTVTAVAYDKIYDGNRIAQADLSAAGVISGDDISFDGKARFGNKNAKLNKKVTVKNIMASGADAGNYSFNDTAETRATIARLALDLDAVAEDKVYDGNKTAIVQSLTSAGIISGDDIAFSYNSAEFEDKNVGTDKKVEIKGISASGSDANNYAHLSEVETKADITKKGINIDASAQDKVYDGLDDATADLIISGLVSGDDVSFDFVEANFDNKNVGQNKPVTVTGISANGSDAGNYSFSTTTQTNADITPKQIVLRAYAADKVYDGTTDAWLGTNAYGHPHFEHDGMVAGDNFWFSFSKAKGQFSDKNVGNNKQVVFTGVTANGADKGNYTFDIQNVYSTADITPKHITLRAYAADKIYDGTTDAWLGTNAYGHPHFEHDGMVAGDNFWFSFSKAKGHFSDKNAGQGKQVKFTGVTANGADKGNYTYDIQNVYSTANITPKQVDLTVYAHDKVYDDNAVATLAGYETNGVLAGDQAWVSYDNAYGWFDNKQVGTNKTVTFTGMEMVGADQGNYKFEPTVFTTAGIIQRQGYGREFLRNFKQYINAYIPEISAIILNEPKKMAYPLPLTQEDEQ